MERAAAVVGLLFGDEGKGTITDYLVKDMNASLVVRHNGGCQAYHNVVTEGGIHHGFSQFGSGTFRRARTFLSRFMLVEPFALLKEVEVLEGKGINNPLEYVIMDPECVIITPFHWLANQIHELARGGNRHGSVGRGVGEARSDELEDLALRAKDLGSNDARRILTEIKDKKIGELSGLKDCSQNRFYELCGTSIDELCDEYARFPIKQQSWRNVARNHKNVVFEGAQGVLLDEKYGFAPHNSWTDCTFGNAERLMEECGGDLLRIGVLRSYFTRHGAGPFPTEDAELTESEEELHNKPHTFMGEFRIGHFDCVLASYAVRVCNGIDGFAITNLDRTPSLFYRYGELNEPLLTNEPKYSRSKDTSSLVEVIKSVAQAPLLIESWGPTAATKKMYKILSVIYDSSKRHKRHMA